MSIWHSPAKYLYHEPFAISCGVYLRRLILNQNCRRHNDDGGQASSLQSPEEELDTELVWAQLLSSREQVSPVIVIFPIVIVIVNHPSIPLHPSSSSLHC